MWLSKMTDEEIYGLSKETVEKAVFSEAYDDGKTFYDVALLLGGPLDTMESRAKECARIYLDGRIGKIFPTGGVKRDGLTEAQILKNYLVKSGVKEEDIILEELATTTVENMICSTFAIHNALRFYDLRTVIVVSSHDHIRRSLALANNYLPRSVKIYASYDKSAKEIEWWKDDKERVRCAYEELRLMHWLITCNHMEDFEV